MSDPQVQLDDQPQWPLIPQDLIQYLETQYPALDWAPGGDVDEMKFYGGKRDLIRLLRLQFNRQHEQPDEDEE